METLGFRLLSYVHASTNDLVSFKHALEALDAQATATGIDFENRRRRRLGVVLGTETATVEIDLYERRCRRNIPN